MHHRHLAAACLTLALAATPSAADVPTGSCLNGNGPGATLLFPYFEVDLDGDRNTLIAIQNVSDEPTLAHVVLWTNWGIPTLTFDLYLPGHGTATVGLRDVMQGRLPVTGTGSKLSPAPIPGFPGCLDPIVNPALSDGEIADLQAKHTGEPSNVDGLCWAASTGDATLATGYLTVDATRDCSTVIRLPNDDGYFLEGGTGLATNRNVLAGDFFLIDPGEDFAQGLEAVTLVADADRFGVEPADRETFYRAQTGGRDERAPLSTSVQARFLLGGGFDGGTDLLVWSEPFLGVAPAPCGEPPYISAFTEFYRAEGRDLDANPLGSWNISTAERSLRLAVGGEDLPAAGFGMIEMTGFLLFPGNIGIPPPPEPIQTWMAAAISAEGRFSVGLNAVWLTDDCE